MQARLLIALVISAALGASDDGFAEGVFTGDDGSALRYRVAAPADGGERVPLIVFLHGAGERGDDNRRQLAAMPKRLRDASWRRANPCVVLAPQCPRDTKWTGVNWQERPPAPPTPEPTMAMRLLIALLERAPQELPVDAARVYVLGVSMGGSGAWDLVARRGDLVAAAAPVCGGSHAERGPLYARVPIWTFHGERDEVVDVGLTRASVAAIRAAGGEARFDEYAGDGHGIASRAFATEELWTWLLARRRAALR